MLPAASVRTSQPADSAWAMTYARASPHARENVGRVAPLPGVSVQRAIASMSARIRSTFTAMSLLPLRGHPSLHFFLRNVLAVRRDPPHVAVAVLHTAGAVAVELVLHRHVRRAA